MNTNIFPERLRKARRDKDLSQKQLAEQIGVSTTTLTNYETGKSKLPCADTLFSLANSLDVSIDWLLGNDRFSSTTNERTHSENIQKEDIKNAFNVLFSAFGKNLEIVNAMVGICEVAFEPQEIYAKAIYIKDDCVQKYLSDYEKISSIDIDKNTLNSVLDAIFPKDDFSSGVGEGGFFYSPVSLNDDFPFGCDGD